MMSLKNKFAIVTGSSSGIGRAIAIRLAKEGCKVVVNCKDSIDKAEKVVEEIKGNDSESTFIRADVSKQEDVKQLFKEALDAFGSVDILINNASKQGSSEFWDDKDDEWEQHFRNDFMSAVMCSREFLKINKGKKVKKIVNISSIFGCGDHSNASFMPYSAAKAALNNFTKNLAREVAPNTLVNTIAPGYVRTPMWDNVDEKSIKACENETLIKRMILPEEIADAVRFLLSNDAMTGQVILVDGGLSLK